jgi:hypothetical protein
MRPVLDKCPVCGDALTVVRLHCRTCHTAIEGQFTAGRFQQLSAEQLAFVETFVRCEGKLNRVAEALGLSYPTIRSRLRDVIRALGYEAGAAAEPAAGAASERGRKPDELAQGNATDQREDGPLGQV